MGPELEVLDETRVVVVLVLKGRRRRRVGSKGKKEEGGRCDGNEDRSRTAVDLGRGSCCCCC